MLASYVASSPLFAQGFQRDGLVPISSPRLAARLSISSNSTSKARKMSKGKPKTSSFICEVPLNVSPHEERLLLIRLDCARQIYNACLGEALKRLRVLRETKGFQMALALPKGSEERKEAFKTLNQEFGFTEFALHRYVTQIRSSWLGEYIDSNTAQKLATRAFHATIFYAYGKRGRPRFKGKGWFDSVEGKTNTTGLRWRGNHLHWTGLDLQGMIAPHDPVQQHGLRSRIKYVRLLRRKLNGKNRFYAQLICEGQPYRKEKHKIGSGTVGLDIGPSNIAIASDAEIVLERFCQALQSKQKEIRRLQRRMDRSRRATNPEHYQANGVPNWGKRVWAKSKRYQQTRARLAEVYRKQAMHRKSLHGQLVNHILSLGDQVNLEKLSYISFQKRFGKSVGFRAPGRFVSQLRRKAANAGVVVNEFATRTTKLSQVCVCGAIQKKPLSQRWHSCECGAGPIQRDLFSAWLARYVDGNQLDAAQVQVAWPRADVSLRAASQQVHPAMGQGTPKPNLEKGQSRTPVTPRRKKNRPGEACRDARSVPARKPVLFPGTPGF